MTAQNWLLPDYLSDILPAEARRIEELRRRLLDLYRTHGFEMVTPPLVEYTDSLFAGQQDALFLQTCKLVDQISGRTMGVRADMTPQITRIDAHLLNREGVTRLCYCGSVLHAKPAGLLSDRELMQIGAEIYGYAGPEADYQVIELALESLSVAGVVNPRVDLNHPGITRALIEAFPAFANDIDTIYTYLKDKDVASLSSLLNQYPELPATIRTGLLALPQLYGGVEVLERAKQVLPDLEGVTAGLNALGEIVSTLDSNLVSIDLADVTGYAYHSGVIFALYADGWHEALVRGGRYDNAGSVYGRARPATGFSLDLRKLSAGLTPAKASRAIRAPWSKDEALTAKIKTLRAQGNIVVQEFPNSQFAVDEFVFEQELVFEAGAWILKDKK